MLQPCCCTQRSYRLEAGGVVGPTEVFGVVCDLIGSLQCKLNTIFILSNIRECLFFEWLAAAARLNATKSASLYFIRQ